MCNIRAIFKSYLKHSNILIIKIKIKIKKLNIIKLKLKVLMSILPIKSQNNFKIKYYSIIFLYYLFYIFYCNNSNLKCRQYKKIEAF